MIKGAIFDVDGTLLDSMPMWNDMARIYVKSKGISPEPELNRILSSMSMEEGITYVKSTYGIQEKEEEIAKSLYNIMAEFYEKTVVLKNGVWEFLEAIHSKNIKMTVATASDRMLIEAAFKRLDIGVYFEKIFTCAEVGKGKRDSAIFLEASRCMDTLPEETWVFEDVLHAIETAKCAGFKTVGIFDAASIQEQDAIRNEADIYFQKWEDFESFYEQLKNYN